MRKIKIMRGIPGSGKSTLAQKLRDDAIAMEFFPVIISADNYFINNGVYTFDPSKLGDAHRSCMQRFLLALEDRMDPIIVDNTNLNIEDVAPYVAVGEAYGYDVEIIQVNTDPELAASRNVHSVPRAKVMDMHNRLTRLSLPKRWKRTHITP